MAVKKGILDNFLKPSSHTLYSDNKKDLRSIFIDKNEDDFKPEPLGFLESSLLNQNIKTDSELVTNKEPIGNQLVTNISNQLVINKEPISKHSKIIDDKIKNNKEPISKRISNHNKEPISNQLVNGLVTNQEAEILISKTSGLQRKILFYVVEDCIYRGKLESGFITNETFRIITETNADTVKTVIQRLIKKGLLKRRQGQRGQGGFSSFYISEGIRDAVLKEKRNPSISNQLVNGLVTAISNPLVINKETDKGTNLSSSSSSLINITTTDLSEEWDFDISPYGHFGFTSTQIKQLASLNIISANEVEQSLIEFNYDISNNVPIHFKTTKCNYIMGILRKGTPYSSENYQKEINQVADEMKKRFDQKQLDKQKIAILTWFENLDDNARMVVETSLPLHLKVRYDVDGIFDKEVFAWLKEYFKDQNK